MTGAFSFLIGSPKGITLRHQQMQTRYEAGREMVAVEMREFLTASWNGL